MKYVFCGCKLIVKLNDFLLRQAKEQWIKMKYVEKKFISRVKSNANPSNSKLKRQNNVKRDIDGQLRAFKTEGRVDVLEGAISDSRVSVSSIDSYDSDEEHIEVSSSLHPNMVRMFFMY